MAGNIARPYSEVREGVVAVVRLVVGPREPDEGLRHCCSHSDVLAVALLGAVDKEQLTPGLEHASELRT